VGFISQIAANNTRMWSRPLGYSGETSISDIKYDDTTSTLYVTGTTDSTDPENAGGTVAFLVRLDSYGNMLWNTAWGSDGLNSAQSMVVDTENQVIRVASVENYTPAITSFSADGTQLNGLNWGLVNVLPKSMAALSKDTLFITGSTRVTLDGSAVNGTQYDMFLTKYGVSGLRAWSRVFGSGASESGMSVAVDPQSSAVYVAGTTRAQVFNGKSNGGVDVVLTAFDLDGNVRWSTQFGSNGDDSVSSVQVDSNTGNIYVAGSTPAVFVGDDSSVSGNAFGYIAKFKPDGTMLSTPIYFASSGAASATAIWLCSGENLGYVAGNFNGNGVLGIFNLDWKNEGVVIEAPPNPPAEDPINNFAETAKALPPVIVGVIVASILIFVVLTGCLAYFMCCRRKEEDSPGSYSQEKLHNPANHPTTQISKPVTPEPKTATRSPVKVAKVKKIDGSNV
jgi:hypothetical protein